MNTEVEGTKFITPDLYGELQDQLSISVRTTSGYKSLVNFKRNESLPIHNWYNFKEGYAAELVESMLSEFSIRPGSLVLDPFAGSGTTLLCAQMKGMSTIGFDIDPFFTFVQKCKIDWYKYNVEKIEEIIGILSSIDSRKSSSIDPPQLSSFNGKRKPLFSSRNLQKLLLFKQEISGIETRGQTEGAMLARLALASILESVSIAKKDGKGLRITDNKKTYPVKISLINKLKQMQGDISLMRDFKINPELLYQALTVDTRKSEQVNKSVGSKKADFVMFSPPYLNTFDYTEVYKLELWFLDFVNNYEEFKALRSRTLRSHNLYKWEATKIWHNKVLDKIVDAIKSQELWTEALPAMIQGYFDDMFLSLKNLFNIMEFDSYCIIVVGNSCYGNIPIPTDLLITTAASQIGFEPKEIRIARPLYTSSQQLKFIKDNELNAYMRESIVILKKQKNLPKINSSK